MEKRITSLVIFAALLMLCLVGSAAYCLEGHLESIKREIKILEEEKDNLDNLVNVLYNERVVTGQEGIALVNAPGPFPLKKIIIHVEPIQSGIGKPSPENIMPISGQTDCSIFVSPTDDPQDGSTYNVVFPEEVCKGILTVFSDGTGTLEVTAIKKKIKNMNFSYQSSYGVFRTNGSANFTSSDDGICSVYETTTGSLAQMPDKSIKFASHTWDKNGRIVIKDSRFTTQEALYEAVGDEEIVFEPQNDYPRTYQLKSEQIKTIAGANNIWSDAGNISVVYGDYLGVIEKYMSAQNEFSSVQQMINNISCVEGGYTETCGYYMPNDGGGARYALQCTVPTGYYVPVPGGYATLVPDRYVTPEMFGAYGDGVHDDSSAFNTACTWAAYYGVPLIISKKTYAIGNTVTVGPQCKIKGYDNKLSILMYTGEKTCLDVSSYAEIDGIHLKCDSDYPETIGINVDSAELDSSGTRVNVNIKNCTIEYFRKAGINLNNEWQVNIDNCRIRGYSVGSERKCSGVLFDYDGVILSSWAGSGNLITNCYISYCDYGIYNRGGWDLTLVNDIFEHNNYGVFKHAQGNPTTVIGCWFEANEVGMSGKAYNVIACRGSNTFDQENSKYCIFNTGKVTEINNLVLIGEDGKTRYSVSIDSNGEISATALP